MERTAMIQSDNQPSGYHGRQSDIVFTANDQAFQIPQQRPIGGDYQPSSVDTNGAPNQSAPRREIYYHSNI